MSRVLSRVAAAAVCSLVATTLLVAPASAGTTAAAQVDVGGFGKVGRFGSAVVNIWATCRDAVVQELEVGVTQGEDVGSRAGTFGLVCDSRWHRLEVEVSSSDGGPFADGAVRVDARLTVLDPDSLDPLPQGVDSATVVLRPAAEVRVGWPVKLNATGGASVPVRYRCQRPWVEPALGVSVTQFEGTNAGNSFVNVGIVCDARWHALRVLVVPSARPFVVGQVHVDADLSVSAPVDFDPVDTATASVDRRATRW